MTTDLLTTLTSIPNNSIIGLINDSEKKLYILQGSRNRMLLMENITQIEIGDHTYLDSLVNYRIIVIETCYDRVSRLLHTEYWYNHYEELGYSLVNRRCLLKYKYRIVLNKLGQVIVSVVNKRNDQTIVGVFNKLQDAEEFVEYSKGQFVYANNQLTRDYLCSGR